jgi:hypothetical protein
MCIHSHRVIYALSVLFHFTMYVMQYAIYYYVCSQSQYYLRTDSVVLVHSVCDHYYYY